MITTDELDGLKSALIGPLSTFDPELTSAAQASIDTIVALHCMSCSGDVMLLYLRAQLDVLTLAQDFTREKVDTSTQASSKLSASKSDGFSERHAKAHANATAVATNWAKLIGQRQWAKSGESHQTMGMSEGANSSGNSSATSNRTEARNASGSASGASSFASGLVASTDGLATKNRQDKLHTERHTHRGFRGQRVQVFGGIPLVGTLSGYVGSFDGEVKNTLETEGSTLVNNSRILNGNSFSFTRSSSRDSSRDVSSMSRAASRFSESSRSGGASMSMGLSGNSKQHEDAQSATDSSSHGDSQANSEMAAESKAHSETTGTERSDSNRIVTARKWSQIAVNLAALFAEVQQQYNDYIGRLAASVRPASVYMNTQLPDLTRQSGAWLPVLRGAAFRCQCVGPFCKCGLRNGLTNLNPLPIPQP